ncbi:hypothetical protein NVP1101O_151 [Vibrio phage 1.101.O._10N.261.45.C6]|nr:hypothetical protein NVP1101O_151 [Vibrio phage 1.101.O._10N.261.45.C6]
MSEVISFVSLDGKTVICLDATTSVGYSRENTSTQHSVMSGATVSDTYRIGNPQIAISGLCTYSKSASQRKRPNPQELEREINKIIENYTRVDLTGNSLIPSLADCVILSVSVTQDRYLDAVNVSLVFEQQYVTNKAKVGKIKVPSSKTGGQNNATANGGSGASTAVGEKKEQEYKKTLFKKIPSLFEDSVEAASSVEQP